jgi:Mor family transcriptional regulator
MNTDILDSAAELFSNSLISFGIDENTARCRVTDIIEELAFLFGGQLIYVKKTRNQNVVAERNQRIVADYDGNNCKDLARKYQLSQATIYQIVKAA